MSGGWIANAVLAAVIFATASCARHGDAGSTTPEVAGDVVAATTGALEKWRQAYEIRSVEGLAALYGHDDKVVLVQEGVAIVGWKAIEARLKERLSKVTAARVRLKDILVTPLGPDAAAVTAAMIRELGDATTTLTESGTVSLVLHRIGNAWVIVHEHYSYKRPP